MEDGDAHEMLKARKANKRLYPVEGYKDEELMWEKLINIEKCEKCPQTKHLNNKHEYSICVVDKVFRIKKNPYYSIGKSKQRASHINMKQESPHTSPKGNHEAIVSLAQQMLQE